MNSHDYILNLAKKSIPSYRYDFKEDFNVWREKSVKKLEECLGLPLIKPENNKFKITDEKIRDGVKYIYFTFESEEGYEVSCCFLCKEDLSEKRPLVICLQGHTTGMHISLGEEIYEPDSGYIERGSDFAIRAVKEGMVALAIEQRYMGKCGYADRPAPSCNAAGGEYANQSMAALLMGRVAIGERVWDAMRALDTVFEKFYELIDSEKIMCVGNSGGGTATFYLSCLDERISLSVPSCAVCTFEASVMAMNHCPCNFVPNIRKYFDMGDIGGLIYPRKIVVVCGKEDPIFPLYGVEESFLLINSVYSHFGKEENCALVVGDGGHRFFPEDAWPKIHTMLGC